jgi:carboxypeptidase family protein
MTILISLAMLSLQVNTASIAGSDVLNTGIHIDRQPSGPLEVVIGLDPGMVGGVVRDEKNDAAPGATAVLVPDASRNRRAELYRTATTDTSGRFHLEAVAPGDYTVFSWEDAQAGAWQDSDFIRKFEDRGRRIHVDENGHTTVEIRMIPSER